MKRASRAPAWIGGTILGLMLVFVLFLQSGERAGSKVPGSIGSAEDGGRRALALLLGRVGVRAEGWRQVPAALPLGSHAVWRAAAKPRDGEGPRGKARVLPNVGMHAPEHYAEFVERGGTLIVEGADGLTFLRDELEFEAAEGLAVTTLEGDGPRDVRLRSGETLRIDANLAFEPLDPSSVARELAVVVDESGSEDLALAVEIPIGSGRAIVVADGRPFDNQHVGELDHALLAVRLAEEVPPGGRLLLDEYALGLWDASGPLTVATRPALALFTVNLLALVCLWTWMRATPRAFPRDPEPLESFSPLLRARAQARLFERAERVSLLAPAARGAAFDRLAARHEVGKRREGREAGGPTASDVSRLASALALRGGPELGARATDLLQTRRIATRADLERLARDLARLELDAQKSGDRGSKLGG
ncbi:MAG: hypothetical protein NTY35_08770 [Planctomycetota bacterium]|nr:hypothetical protein [Planctomycetota bacterium]